MATVTKTWVFATNAEGLTEVGDSGNTPFGFFASAGSPSNGCIRFGGNFFGTPAPNEYERARTGTGVTWETWGVPAGATVTNVQITAWKYNTFADVGTCGVKMRVLNSSNTTVHSAGDLVSTTSLTGGGTWYSGSAGTSRAVDASYQASTTSVKFEIESRPGSTLDIENPPDTYDSEAYYDTIELTITYTTGASTSWIGKTFEHIGNWLRIH